MDFALQGMSIDAGGVTSFVRLANLTGVKNSVNRVIPWFNLLALLAAPAWQNCRLTTFITHNVFPEIDPARGWLSCIA
jgi:hypothetical protein